MYTTILSHKIILQKYIPGYSIFSKKGCLKVYFHRLSKLDKKCNLPEEGRTMGLIYEGTKPKKMEEDKESKG